MVLLSFSFDVGQKGGSRSWFSRCPGWARCSDLVGDHHRRWRCTPSCWRSWQCWALSCRCLLPTRCCCQSGRCMQSPSRCCCRSCSWWTCSSRSCCHCCWWPLSQCTSCCRCSSQCRCSILLCRCCCQRRCCGTIFVSELLLNSSSLSMLFSMLSCLLFCLMLNTLSSLSSAKSILLMSCLVVRDVVAEVIFHILLSNFLSKSSSLMMLILSMFCWTLRTLSMLSTSLSIPLLSGRVVQSRCLHIFVANFCWTNSLFSSLLSLLFCSSFAWADEDVALLGVVNPFLWCQVLLFKPSLSIFLLRTLLTKLPLLIVVVVAVGSSTASDSDVEPELTESDVVTQLLLSSRWTPVGPPGRWANWANTAELMSLPSCDAPSVDSRGGSTGAWCGCGCCCGRVVGWVEVDVGLWPVGRWPSTSPGSFWG